MCNFLVQLNTSEDPDWFDCLCLMQFDMSLVAQFVACLAVY